MNFEFANPEMNSQKARKLNLKNPKIEFRTLFRDGMVTGGVALFRRGTFCRFSRNSDSLEFPLSARTLAPSPNS